MAEMDNTQPPTLSTLAQLPMFRELDVNIVTRLADAARERGYTKGEIIFRAGDKPTGLFILTEGLIKEACMSADGKEKILELLDAPQSFGESALFLDAPYPYYAAALADTRLLHIDRAVFFDLAFSQPGIAMRLLRTLSERVFTLVRDVESYTTHRHVQRLAHYLIARCSEHTESPINVTLPASKQVIASRLGMTPETFSRNLRDLGEAGFITVHGERIEIHDLARLKAFAS
jgi:CRP/FNR family transcriptional regulator, dissimilatory nitrate respiration regulator